jgi:predicted MFS family arabinose efflux permease
MGGSVTLVLLVFGVASMVSTGIVGAHIDRRFLRTLIVAGTVLVAVAATVLAVLAASPPLVYVAVTLWGLGWGGVPTLLQTAVGDAGGEKRQRRLVTIADKVDGTGARAHTQASQMLQRSDWRSS